MNLGVIIIVGFLATVVIGAWWQTYRAVQLERWERRRARAILRQWRR